MSFEELLINPEEFSFTRGDQAYLYVNKTKQYCFNKVMIQNQWKWKGHLMDGKGKYININEALASFYAIPIQEASKIMQSSSFYFSTLKQAQIHFEKMFKDIELIHFDTQLEATPINQWKAICSQHINIKKVYPFFNIYSSRDFFKDIKENSYFPVFTIRKKAELISGKTLLKEFKTKPQIIKYYNNILQKHLPEFYFDTVETYGEQYYQTSRKILSDPSCTEKGLTPDIDINESAWWSMFVKPEVNLTDIFK